MNASPSRPGDPAALAQEIRSLANDAYRNLNKPVAHRDDVRELSRRIAELQRQVDRLAAADLSLWLENLRRRIDAPQSPLAPAQSPYGRPTGDGARSLAG